MKKIPKKLLDECIEASRKYWATGNKIILDKKQDAAENIADAIGISWLAVDNFIDGILNSYGICPDATNDEIYCALRTLGWDVTE